MDLPIDSIDNQHLTVSPADPLVCQTFNAFHKSVNTMEQQFNVIDDFCVSNIQSSPETLPEFHENFQYIADEVASHWAMNSSPLFSNECMLHDNVLFDELYSQFSKNNELQIASEPIEIPMTDELQQASTQPPSVERLNSADDNNLQFPMTDEQQLISEPTQPSPVELLMSIDNSIPQTLTTDESQLAPEPIQIPKINELQLASNLTQIPKTEELQQVLEPIKIPTAKILNKTQQCKKRPRYRTRRVAYDDALKDYIIRAEKMRKDMINNQQVPKLEYTEDGKVKLTRDLEVRVLKLDIPIKKFPKYSDTKRYKPRKAKKIVPTTSTTSHAKN